MGERLWIGYIEHAAHHHSDRPGHPVTILEQGRFIRAAHEIEIGEEPFDQLDGDYRGNLTLLHELNPVPNHRI